MLRSTLIALVGIAIGLYAGFQLPRGAGLITALTNIATEKNENDYSGLASHQALLDFQSSIDGARKMVLTDARSEQEAIEGMRWLLRVAAMSTHILADANPDAPRFQRMLNMRLLTLRHPGNWKASFCITVCNLLRSCSTEVSSAVILRDTVALSLAAAARSAWTCLISTSDTSSSLRELARDASDFCSKAPRVSSRSASDFCFPCTFSSLALV